MKFSLISDLHTDIMDVPVMEITDCDAILVAGDVALGSDGIRWLHDNIRREGTTPLLYITGNHEYWDAGLTYEEIEEKIKQWEFSNIHFLQNKAYAFYDQKTVVLGCTLWTDFLYNGNPNRDIGRAMHYIPYDYSSGYEPNQILEENKKSTYWLQTNIQNYKELGWKTVVMTHHAPTTRSVGPRYRFSENNVYFVNTFDKYQIFDWPDVWVHGHVHDPFDYQINGCRVLCNPRGRTLADGSFENPAFDHNFRFEV